jgi:hypothetical protein
VTALLEDMDTRLLLRRHLSDSPSVTVSLHLPTAHQTTLSLRTIALSSNEVLEMFDLYARVRHFPSRLYSFIQHSQFLYTAVSLLAACR